MLFLGVPDQKCPQKYIYDNLRIGPNGQKNVRSKNILYIIFQLNPKMVAFSFIKPYLYKVSDSHIKNYNVFWSENLVIAFSVAICLIIWKYTTAPAPAMKVQSDLTPKAICPKLPLALFYWILNFPLWCDSFF